MTSTEVLLAHRIVDESELTGQDLLGMHDTLTALGYEVGFLGDHVSGEAKNHAIDAASVPDLLRNPDLILIYHHSAYWDYGDKLLRDFQGKLIIKYHSIPPPYWFRSYSPRYYEKWCRGFSQTASLIQQDKKCVWWVNSHFDSVNLHQCGLDADCFVVPPFIKDRQQHEPNYHIIDTLINNHCNNILFAGRVMPNRGYTHLIEIIKHYIECYDPNIHLWIVGPIDHTQPGSYYNELVNVIHRNTMQHYVTFTHAVPSHDLYGYYLGCDAFLCMSEDEGFYAPLIEAQRIGLPVVTHGGTGPGETAGINQIVLDQFDYDFAASALYTLYTDKRVKQFCRHHGQKNAQSRFSQEQITKEFISAFEQSISGFSG